MKINTKLFLFFFTMNHQMPGGSTVVDAYRKLTTSLICNLPVELCQIPVCYAPAKGGYELTNAVISTIK